MEDTVRRFLKAYEALTEQQKKEVLDDLKSTGTKGELREELSKDLGVVMGPLGGKCPYCGK